MAPNRSSFTTSPRRTNGIWRAASVLGVAFVGLQAIRPALPRATVTNDLGAPPDVERILRRSCYDCHSDEPRLRWFDQLAPAYWLVAADVQAGRAHLNFSELGNATTARKRALLYESLNHVLLGAMPPRRYTLLHPGAALAPEDLAILEKYLDAERPAYPPPVASTPGPASPMATEVRAAPNGLAFISGYESWQAISTSERFENGTVRFILANDVAARAIEANRISPWPDGAALAKVLWIASVDAKGIVRPETFQQVDFMVKDAKRSAATLGWTWGRWVGADLVPYGNTPSFALECSGCHAPMRENDAVFTMPIQAGAGHEDLFNREAVLPADPSRGALAWRVITMSVDPARGTTSTVYGNERAFEHARSGSPAPYAPGSEVARVTWLQRASPHWHGARIPGRVASLELLTVGASGDGDGYSAYEGSSLSRMDLPAAEGERRRAELLGVGAAFMPDSHPQAHRN